MRRLIRATAIVGQAALWLVLLGFLVLVALPRLTSFDVLVVRGSSMEPTIHLGSAVVVDRNARSPTVGAIATFHDPEAGLITHRVVAIEGAGFVTQGDANRTPDGLRRPSSSVYGAEILDIPYVGYVIHALQQPLAFLLLLLGTGGLLVVDALRTIAREVARMRRERGRADEA